MNFLNIPLEFYLLKNDRIFFYSMVKGPLYYMNSELNLEYIHFPIYPLFIKQRSPNSGSSQPSSNPMFEPILNFLEPLTSDADFKPYHVGVFKHMSTFFSRRFEFTSKAGKLTTLSHDLYDSCQEYPFNYSVSETLLIASKISLFKYFTYANKKHFTVGYRKKFKYLPQYFYLHEIII